MSLKKLFVAVLALALSGSAALAQEALRIAVLNDMSGPYADYQGRGSVVAAQLAVEDMGGKVNGRPVELISGDHQNKPDVGSALARQWFDLQNVQAVFDLPNSAVALAVAQIARDKNKVMIASGGGSAELTGAKCSPNTVQWTYDTWEVGHALGQAVVARGGKKWFILAADYAFGIDLENSMADAVRSAGGQVVGTARAPFPTTDFSSFLVQAQSSGADVLGLANAGDDQTTSIKQAAEFGLTKSMQVAGPVVNINVIHGVGLSDAQGLLIVTPFYWDMNDGTRAFAKRYQERDPKHFMPNDMQAGVYASVLAYLKAVATVPNSSDGRAVVDKMKQQTFEDPLFGKTTIRADGRALHPIYLMQAKAPGESRGPWDYLKPLDTVPADKAFRPLDQGGCPMIKQTAK